MDKNNIQIFAGAATCCLGIYFLYKHNKRGQDTNTEGASAALPNTADDDEMAKADPEAASSDYVEGEEELSEEAQALDTRMKRIIIAAKQAMEQWIEDFKTGGHNVDNLSQDEKNEIQDGMDAYIVKALDAEGYAAEDLTESEKEAVSQIISECLSLYTNFYKEVAAQHTTRNKILVINDSNRAEYIQKFKVNKVDYNFLVLDAEYDVVAFTWSGAQNENIAGIRPKEGMEFTNGYVVKLIGNGDQYNKNVRLSEGAAGAQYGFARYTYQHQQQPNNSVAAFYEFMYYNRNWYSKTY